MNKLQFVTAKTGNFFIFFFHRSIDVTLNIIKKVNDNIESKIMMNFCLHPSTPHTH